MGFDAPTAVRMKIEARNFPARMKTTLRGYSENWNWAKHDRDAQESDKVLSHYKPPEGTA